MIETTRENRFEVVKYIANISVILLLALGSMIEFMYGIFYGREKVLLSLFLVQSIGPNCVAKNVPL